MIAIVAIDENWAIGKNNELLTHLPSDLKFFKEKTEHEIVIMGRKTLESLPGGKPLKNRINIVVTSRDDYYAPGTVIANSIAGAVRIANNLTRHGDKKVFVIGGQTIYEQLLPFCQEVWTTKILHEFDGADAHFPDITKTAEWTWRTEPELWKDGKYKYIRQRYRRIIK